MKSLARIVSLSFLLNFIVLFAKADTTIIKYYDSLWLECSKEKSFYKLEAKKQDSLYDVRTYFTVSNKINSTGKYRDSTLSKGVGTLVRYYESGMTKDTAFFNDEGKIFETYHYYETGKLFAHAREDASTKEVTTVAYAENGDKIPNFIFDKRAEFKGGLEEWQYYLFSNTKKFFSAKEVPSNAKEDMIKVIVSFVVDERGKVLDVKVARTSGYEAVDKDAIKVVSKSPRWNNSIYLNKPVKAGFRQPITYLITTQ